MAQPQPSTRIPPSLRPELAKLDEAMVRLLAEAYRQKEAKS